MSTPGMRQLTQQTTCSIEEFYAAAGSQLATSGPAFSQMLSQFVCLGVRLFGFEAVDIETEVRRAFNRFLNEIEAQKLLRKG